MIKGVTQAHLGSIWYHSEPSDVPYSPNQLLALDFAASYGKTALAMRKNMCSNNYQNFHGPYDAELSHSIIHQHAELIHSIFSCYGIHWHLQNECYSAWTNGRNR